MAANTIFTKLLTALDVPHTAAYSDRRYRTMTFRSVYGFSKLLADYGIDSEALQLTDRSDFARLQAPFVAGLDSGFVLVESTGGGSVTYSYGSPDDSERATASTEAFMRAWTGIVLLAFPSPQSQEPDYRRHHLLENAGKAKSGVLIAASAFLFLYLFIAHGLWRHGWSAVLTVLGLAGIYISYLLLLKQLNIRSRQAERVCSVIEAGGCNTVLSTKASKFFGLFGWSEVGFAYFSVSLAVLLLAPSQAGNLAVLNLCCLPFSFWSVWYQKFRARAWCTLCLCVQCLLWLSAGCYLWGGCIAADSISLAALAALGAAYLAALLGLNRLIPAFDRTPDSEKQDL